VTTVVDVRPMHPTVAELITRLPRAGKPYEIAAIADQLGDARDPCAIRPLLERLGDRQVQTSPDVEDSVCRALVALGVMRSCGEFSFAMRPRHLLTLDVVDMITELGPAVPMRYLIARQV
jgi:hypothetical protein